jgi:hypothetical protein
MSSPYRWFPDTGRWVTHDIYGRQIWPKPVWEGPKQVEDRSSKNIRACYRFLRAVPYQSSEDLARLEEQERISVAEAIVAESME